MLASVLVCAGALAADRGIVVSDVEVRAQPQSDAPAVGQLLVEAPVEVVERRGAWIAVKAPPLAGWVRMLSIRPVATTAVTDDSGVRAALNVARQGSSGAAVATGVRGLDRNQLAAVTPAPAELGKLAAWQSDRGDAEMFAFEEKPALASHSIGYLNADGQPVKAPADAAQKKARQ